MYKSDFELFLSYTDEKIVLLEELSKILNEVKAESLLDIGAGNGLLSIPLASKVKRYVAVEPKESFAKKLSEANINVIQKLFPTTIEGTYDIVLASHSISYKKM